MAMIRTIEAGMDAAVAARIDARLADIRRDHQVMIPLAVESGSRAWGFPSPDSDYDCRFVFVRRAEHYLSLCQRPDIIETPMDGKLDVNGWDLAKALRLLLKGNAVIIEWLMSPLAYSLEPRFRDEFLALARAVTDRQMIARHYLHMGSGKGASISATAVMCRRRRYSMPCGRRRPCAGCAITRTRL